MIDQYSIKGKILMKFKIYTFVFNFQSSFSISLREKELKNIKVTSNLFYIYF